MNEGYSISIIIPVYNEIQLLEKSLYKIDNFLKNNFKDYEIIIVESGSTDGSSEACDKLSKILPKIKLIHEGLRNGFGSALRLGYKTATKDILCPVTVDLPFKLESILRAISLFSEYDCVLSYRCKDNRRFNRRIQSAFYNNLIKIILGLKVKHVNSALKLFKKELINNIPLVSNGWFIDAEIIYMIKKQRISHIEIPVELIERTAGKSSINCITFISVLREFIYFIIKMKKKNKNYLFISMEKILNLPYVIYDLLWRYISFRKSRIRHFDKNKFRILIRKSKIALLILWDLALLPVAIVIVFIVRALRPFVLIRCAQFSHRIGHFTADVEQYLCKLDMKKKPFRPLFNIDIFYCKKPICNKQLKKMWSRVLRIWNFSSYFARVNLLLPGGEVHYVSEFSDPDTARDTKGFIAHGHQHLFFTFQEQQKGIAALQKIGIPNDASFICFYMRDAAYLKHYFHTDFYYHNYRDCNIENCRLAVEKLANRGYYMFRMGAVVKGEFKSNNLKIIDYATKYRTDFLDIFLLSRCHFFISSGAGLAGVAIIFRRPIAWVNCAPLVDIPQWGRNDLFIPKKVWLKKERRFMTFREILDSGAGWFYDTEQFDKFGLENIENNPEEIKGLALEMEERLNNKWKSSPEDEELQSRFWSLFKSIRVEFHHSFYNSEANKFARIGSEFLRHNRELLK